MNQTRRMARQVGEEGQENQPRPAGLVPAQQERDERDLDRKREQEGLEPEVDGEEHVYGPGTKRTAVARPADGAAVEGERGVDLPRDAATSATAPGDATAKGNATAKRKAGFARNSLSRGHAWSWRQGTSPRRPVALGPATRPDRCRRDDKPAPRVAPGAQGTAGPVRRPGWRPAVRHRRYAVRQTRVHSPPSRTAATRPIRPSGMRHG